MSQRSCGRGRYILTSIWSMDPSAITVCSCIVLIRKVARPLYCPNFYLHEMMKPASLSMVFVAEQHQTLRIRELDDFDSTEWAPSEQTQVQSVMAHRSASFSFSCRGRAFMCDLASVCLLLFCYLWLPVTT